MNFPILLNIISAGVLLGSVARPAPVVHSHETVSFFLKLQDNSISYRTFSSFVLPRETLSLEIATNNLTAPIQLESAGGEQRPTGKNSWEWKAPERIGLYLLTFKRTDTDERIVLNVFVMRPYSELKGEYLNGYRIGKYPQPHRHSRFARPAGFIEVTKDNENTLVSPHFRLKQFLCKQPGGYPKYIVLKERLLEKLERTLALVNQIGYRYSGFHIMSAYRTPAYNKSLGNVAFSRHMIGEAADILMDGAAGQSIPASLFYRLVDREQKLGDERNSGSGGGLGIYQPTRSHGPFVHIDVRTYLARWEG